MSIEEDTINSIINFFHKLLGNKLWILPVSVAIASWYIYFYHPDIWPLLYVAIICSLIAILHVFSVIFIWIKNAITNYRKEKATKEAAIKRREQERATNERKNREHADAIWKFVAHLDNDIIEAATLFLSLDIHDEDKHIRFVRIPNDPFSTKGKLYKLYFDTIHKLTFSNGYRPTYKLIREERVNDIMYFHIEPYFFSLIDNYKSTGNWIKV